MKTLTEIITRLRGFVPRYPDSTHHFGMPSRSGSGRQGAMAILYIVVFTIPLITTAQTGLTGFPELVMTKIPGAPTLGKPMLITGTDYEMISEGHGLAAPAVWDFDRDGLNDLLIGEFGSGLEHGRFVGNFVRVFANIGTNTEPQFNGKWDYARPPFQYKVQAHGTGYSVDQFCCMGFTPQFIDLNSDGYVDMITGQYQGEVSWFRGSEDGFMPGEALPQEGNPRDPDRKTFMYGQPYWLYSSASFGDFTRDSLPDLIVGGSSLRISRNIGTRDNPQFAKRELLTDSNGNPLNVYDYRPEELKEKQKMEELTKGISKVPVAGDHDLSPYVVDWDNDGILDLLVTNSYSHGALAAVSFFKGVKVSNEHRFHPGIPLFTAATGKAFPGSGPRIFVADWNTDGVSDLIIGTSVVTVNGEFNDQLSWNWEKDMNLHGAGKDPANLTEAKAAISANQMKWYRESVKLPEGITIDDYMTIRHNGYVYVMLGRKEESKPVSKKKTKAK
ncbi:MAG TPA: VCBS repeat-containing protein [Chryseolinea sp.]|nr:VCBS repeat-containing protein [Chryseolinea sp.]